MRFEDNFKDWFSDKGECKERSSLFYVYEGVLSVVSPSLDQFYRVYYLYRVLKQAVSIFAKKFYDVGLGQLSQENS